MSSQDSEEIFSSDDTYIRGLFGLLEHCEAQIKQRESELALLQTQKMTLNAQIAHHHNSKSPINRLSDEVLLLIFAERVQEEPVSIGPILLVCRRWNIIALNSPILWKNVRFSLASSEAGIRRQTRYVEAAMRNSQPAPLDVHITFPTIQELWDHFSQQQLGNMSHIFYAYKDHSSHITVGYYDDSGGLRDWFFRSDEDACQRLVLFGMIDAAIYECMVAVCGKDGDYLQRLRSLTLVFDTKISSTWLLDDLFNHPMPLIEDLALLDCKQEGDNSYFPFSSHAPNLSRIACDFSVPISDLVSAGKLNQLHFRFSMDTRDYFPSVEYTDNLKVLYIKFPRYIDLRSIGKYEEDLVFPVLDSLTLEGMWPSHLIRAPRLTTLRLMDKDSVTFFSQGTTSILSVKASYIRNYK